MYKYLKYLNVHKEPIMVWMEHWCNKVSTMTDITKEIFGPEYQFYRYMTNNFTDNYY